IGGASSTIASATLTSNPPISDSRPETPSDRSTELTTVSGSRLTGLIDSTGFLSRSSISSCPCSCTTVVVSRLKPTDLIKPRIRSPTQPAQAGNNILTIPPGSTVRKILPNETINCSSVTLSGSSDNGFNPLSPEDIHTLLYGGRRSNSRMSPILNNSSIDLKLIRRSIVTKPRQNTPA